MADVTQLTVRSSDVTIISSTSATITTGQIAFSDSTPNQIGRTGSAGIANTASRSDHTHGAESLLLDGGNF